MAKQKEFITEFVNPQDILVESLEGIHLVDAGAGTGKTHTIIRRYNKLIESGVKPEEILLITFTNVAAMQMKEDVISKIVSDEVSITELLEAPVMTFHALCTRLLKSAGSNAPRYLGIDETLSSNFNVIEDGVFENALFRRFFTVFKIKKRKKFEQTLLSLENDHGSVLEIIKKLCSTGIFPSKEGWIEDGYERLKGNFDEFSESVTNQNRQKKNEKTDAFYALRDESGEVQVDFELEKYATDKIVREEKLNEIFFDESQDKLIEFIREIYLDYIEFIIKRNQMNFEFLVMFAYLKLLKDDSFREKAQFRYLMVDEFQDTDKIQFKLLLLLCRNEVGKANLMVVGDWRQGIYGFRNTTIDNITKFEKSIEVHKASINGEGERISYETSIDGITKITFENNYRSSQEILDFSRNALFIRAVDSEENEFEYESVNFANTLRAARAIGKYTDIGFLQSSLKEEEDEMRMILQKIKELVSNEKYKICEFDDKGKMKNVRRVRYSDIVVLSRTRDFCIKLQKDSIKFGVPVTYDGGFEIFASKQGILVLAWLKFLLHPNDASAITTILENEGFDFRQIAEFLTEQSPNIIVLPQSVTEFRSELKEMKDNIIYLIEAINGRYGFNDEFAKAITESVDKWIQSDLISLGELVAIMEGSLLEDFGIELSKTYDSVTCQTIHSSKGLEYPVVILANVNKMVFPSFKNTSGKITYSDAAGLRMKKVYAQVNGYWGNFDNWRSHFVSKMCREDNYSESRRLLYVALTRAKQYLFLTAFNPSKFFTELSEKTGMLIQNDFRFEGEVNYESLVSEKTVEVPEPKSTVGKVESISVKRYVRRFHDSEDYTNTLGNSFHGMEFGREVHLAAFKHAKGFKQQGKSKAEQKIVKFIDSLNAQRLEPEIDFSHRKGGKIIRGTIDLIAHYDDKILVVDYKTDKEKSRHESYLEQVNLYIDAVKELYNDKQVSGVIYYVGLDEQIYLG